MEEEYQEQLRKYWEEFDKKLEAADEIIPGLKVKNYQAEDYHKSFDCCCYRSKW